MNSQTSSWYEIENVDTVDSPALVVYPARVEENIQTCINIAGDKTRLRPHVKTHKVGQVAAMHIEHGIDRFKCATIAEAEMLAEATAKEVLLAHQPVGPKEDRIITLAKRYPNTAFGILVDNEATVASMAAKAKDAGIALQTWIDINNGMNRSGIEPGPAVLELYKQIIAAPSLEPGGLHVYDGHFRQSIFNDRKEASDEGFEAVYLLLDKLKAEGIEVPAVVAGGSPTFPVHALRKEIELSPGTYVYWDAGYGEKFPDMPFKHAALLVTRVISKPAGNFICLDLGSKAVSPDNPLPNRVRFINKEVTAYIGQSEEHLVVAVPNPEEVSVGDVWYGVPYHVCPSVALHQEALAVIDGIVSEAWPIHARDRRIHF